MRLFPGCAISLLLLTTFVNAQTFTTLASFNGTDGSLTYYETLAQGINGSIYGTTERGGTSTACSYNCGTIFKITPAGTLTPLINLDLTDGSYPYAGLVLATNSEFYGTTSAGGANGYGTIFKITPKGTFTSLHSFDISDGYYPYGTLIQAANGDLYGTTYAGGSGGYGTIFSITPGGTLTTIHDFALTDGGYLYGALVQAANGD